MGQQGRVRAWGVPSSAQAARDAEANMEEQGEAVAVAVAVAEAGTVGSGVVVAVVGRVGVSVAVAVAVAEVGGKVVLVAVTGAVSKGLVVVVVKAEVGLQAAATAGLGGAEGKATAAKRVRGGQQMLGVAMGGPAGKGQAWVAAGRDLGGAERAPKAEKAGVAVAVEREAAAAVNVAGTAGAAVSTLLWAVAKATMAAAVAPVAVEGMHTHAAASNAHPLRHRNGREGAGAPGTPMRHARPVRSGTCWGL